MRFDKIVDLHCHILPGIDDGSKNLETSLKLAEAAVADGVTHILATPHHLDNDYVNHKDDVIKVCDDFQTELDNRDIPLTVFPGQEVHINGDLVERYDDLLGIDEQKRYMLLEFPHGDVPGYAEQLIFDLKRKGTIPVIVHPERNKKIQDNLDIYMTSSQTVLWHRSPQQATLEALASTLHRFRMTWLNTILFKSLLQMLTACRAESLF